MRDGYHTSPSTSHLSTRHRFHYSEHEMDGGISNQMRPIYIKRGQDRGAIFNFDSWMCSVLHFPLGPVLYLSYVFA